MGSYFRRCVCLSPAGLSPGSILDPTTRDRVLRSGAKWVRLWADWAFIEPYPTYGYFPNGWDDPLTVLDRQISMAKSNGLSVILVMSQFPQWANQTQGMASNAFPEDRYSGGKWKALTQRFPDNLTAGSAYYHWMNFLMDRYHKDNPNKPFGNAFIEVLEICNEPNLVTWPQRTKPEGDPYQLGNMNSFCRVADMVVTAQGLHEQKGRWPYIGVPALDDHEGDSTRIVSNFSVFTDELLKRLGQINFHDSANFIWTHHNYRDVVQAPSLENSRAMALDRILSGRWAGFPTGQRGGNFDIWLTEGGGNLKSISRSLGISISDRNALKFYQDRLVLGNMEKMQQHPHVYQWSQYLSYTDPCFDSGFADPTEPIGTTPRCSDRVYETGGGLRPMYSTFASTRWGSYQ